MEESRPAIDPGITEPAAHRPNRKRKVKRSSRIKKKLPLILGLFAAWLILMAIWFYLIGIGQRPPAEITP
jgi:hypothetical protein